MYRDLDHTTVRVVQLPSKLVNAASTQSPATRKVLGTSSKSPRDSRGFPLISLRRTRLPRPAFEIPFYSLKRELPPCILPSCTWNLPGRSLRRPPWANGKLSAVPIGKINQLRPKLFEENEKGNAAASHRKGQVPEDRACLKNAF